MKLHSSECHWIWLTSNIGSGNGLVPSGTKPLPESMLTQIHVTIWCHQAIMSLRSTSTWSIETAQWAGSRIMVFLESGFRAACIYLYIYIYIWVIAMFYGVTEANELTHLIKQRNRQVSIFLTHVSCPPPLLLDMHSCHFKTRQRSFSQDILIVLMF